MGCGASIIATPTTAAPTRDASKNGGDDASLRPPIHAYDDFSHEPTAAASSSTHGANEEPVAAPSSSSSAKYLSPRDGDSTTRISQSIPQDALLAMAMEADKIRERPGRNRALSRTGGIIHDAFDSDETSHEMPDLAYSIRGSSNGLAASSSASSVAQNAAALSRNVVVNGSSTTISSSNSTGKRPSLHNLKLGGSAVNAEFRDQHLQNQHNAGHVFAFPMPSGSGTSGGPFVPTAMQEGGRGGGGGGGGSGMIPIGGHMHPSVSGHHHPHGAYHLAPLDITTGLPAGGPSFRDYGSSSVNGPGALGALGAPGGRGRGRGLPTVVMGPNAALVAGGFRGQPLPVGPHVMLGAGGGPGRGQGSGVMGRGRGQPLQIVIPGNRDSHRGGSDSSRFPVESSARTSQRTGDRPPPTAAARDDDVDDDDDDEDLVEEGEEVEDWGLEEEQDEKPVQVTQTEPTRAPPSAVDTQAKPPTTKKFRPGMEITDDSIQQVDSDSNSDDDDSDMDGGSGDVGDEELCDWLDTSPNPQQLLLQQKPSATTLSPAKLSSRQEIHSSRSVPNGAPPSSLTPHGANSPTRTASSPTHRAGMPVHSGVSAQSPHPPLPTQQLSMRQLPAFSATGAPGAAGTAGHISPTRPAGPPPTGASPVKNPSYRSNIVTSGLPVIMPLSAVSSPMTANSPVSPATGAAAIRDTKVVKKKRAELPQVNLPHPVPKFGDWLNSRTMINNYIILEPLGAGSYAEVKLCKEKVTGKLFAMKFINRDVMKKDKLGKQSKLDDIKREIAIMKKLNHPNVLRLYEVMDDPSMNKLFLVLEYMKHGDLMGHQKKKLHSHNGGSTSQNLHDRDLHCVLLQVILGLAYLHEQKIVHGDIKPQNLLVGDKDVVKIADFGISQSLYGSKQKLSDTAGTPAFMSPEMCSGQEYSGQLADIWAVGATVFMLKFGNPPFVAKSAMQMFEKIQNDPLVFPGPVDPLLEDLLRGMLTKNPHKRTTLLQIMTHPWVTKEEHPSHFVIKDKTPQITVTSEEIENAIDASDKFAIIVNIRVQMMKRLQRARHEILKRRTGTETANENTVQTHKMLIADVAHMATAAAHGSITTAIPESQPSPVAHPHKNSSRRSGHKIKPNKVFVDTSESTSGGETDETGHKMLSSEEIQYRSQLFTRKKVSGVATTAAALNGASSAALSKGGAAAAAIDHEELRRFRDLVASSSTTAAASGDHSDEDDEDDDALSGDDDDDELAVSQSPQLLDELLLTTLSMPPLVKASPSQSETTHTKPPTNTQPSASAMEPPRFASASGTATTHPHPHPPTASHALDPQSFFGANPSLNISVAVASLQGRRNTQEDRWTVLPHVDASVSSRWSNSLFAGMYDGHGGEECANILQDQLHAWLFRAPDDHVAVVDKLQQCFVEFDTFLCDYLFHKGDLSGSTATCLLVDHTKSNPALAQYELLVGHVGDCRLVLVGRNGETRDVTSDHRLTLQAERDRVLELGGRVVNNRVNGVMAITRAFGDLEFKGLMGTQRLGSHGSSIALLPEAVQPSPFQCDDEHTPALLTARPDIHFMAVDGARDEFLLLACDGLWDVMTSDEATEILRDRFHFHGDLQLAAKELAQEGIRRYSNDNISVLVVHFPMPTPAPM